MIRLISKRCELISEANTVEVGARRSSTKVDIEKKTEKKIDGGFSPHTIWS